MTLPANWVIGEFGKIVEGGQAHVYPVHPRDGSGRFALKRLKNSASAARVARFRREVKAMRDLSAEGLLCVPPVVDADLDVAKPYFVMPWYPDGSLQVAVDEALYRNKTREGIQLCIGIGQAIAEVHAKGVAHRDLKPANVFLTEQGIVLSDFGLCLESEGERERLTLHGEAVGSRLYIAPENESGINEEQDQRPADLYAFGKIIWALLAGRLPFAREAFRNPDWRLSAICTEPKLDKLDGVLEMLLVADVRTRQNTEWQAVLSELQAVEAAITGQPALSVPVQPNAIELARAYANRADVVQQRADEARYYEAVNWIAHQVRVPLIETLDTAIAPLRDVQQASLNEFQFFREMPRQSFDLTDYFPQFLSLPRSRPQTSSTTEGPHAVADSKAGSPRLTMAIWVHLSAQGVWVARMPIVHYSIHVDLPRLVLDRFGRVIGPLPTRREATVAEISAFVADAGVTFVKLAARYVLMVTHDEDLIVGDKTRWYEPDAPA